ncbi:MAG: S-methyl-5'-thioadenosine phosphorylase [Alphaproteobacteria bacterium]|nr:S-methyl-5'-thioadenosine phosphorylase [Alphaproteobacteria bacterium]
MAEPGTPPVLGILGGSGIYDIGGLTKVAWQKVATPWGDPSDELMFAEYQGMPLVFLPRHGRGHPIPPTEINFAANIDALKRSGVTEIVSLSAVGSLREELAPGAFVLIDQFIDRTFARRKSFFGRGLVAHVSMADPVCARLGDEIAAAATAHNIQVLRGGTYLTMEGPQFSTRAESELYRHWGASVIGMTNMPEAKLAREAELCYATVAMVTDYDCWHPHHEHVTVDQVVKVLLGNAERARGLLQAVAPRLKARAHACRCGCHRALDAALITAPEKRDAKLMAKLAVVAGRILGATLKNAPQKPAAQKPNAKKPVGKSASAKKKPASRRAKPRAKN